MNKEQIALIIFLALNIGCNRPSVILADRCFFYFEHDNCDQIENYSDCYTNFVELCFDSNKYTAYQSLRGSLAEFEYKRFKDHIKLNEIAFNVKTVGQGQILLEGTADTIRLYEFNHDTEPSIDEVLDSDLDFDAMNFSIASRINHAFYIAFEISEEEIANHISTNDTLYFEEEIELEPSSKEND